MGRKESENWMMRMRRLPRPEWIDAAFIWIFV